MSVKFITNKTYLENANGLKNFEKYNIDYDSNRDKNKQVKASFDSNGKHYYIEDSLQKFMNIMPNSQNSIFDLLKNELHESKKINSNLSTPVIQMKLNNGNVSRKSFKGKYKVNRGITSKLFDYDEQELPHNNNEKIYVSNKHHNKRTHKLEHGRKYDKKYGRKHGKKYDKKYTRK
jgi:hypothetical protein